MPAVHRTYARALLEAARDRGRLGEVRTELEDFVRAADDVPELGALLDNPEVDRGEKRAALEQLLAGADELVRNFLLLLVEKGRIGERRLELELTTAVELSDDEASDLIAQIERAAGQSVEARRSVDPSLIGGAVLQVGSYRVDASVRGRLERLRRELQTSR